MDPIHGLDWGTYYFFRNQRLAGTLDLDAPMLVGMKLGSYPVLGVVALLMFIVLCRRSWPRAPIAFVIMAAVAVGFDQGLKHLVHRRPPNQSELQFSFPSTAALLSSFLLVVLAMIWEKSIPERGLRIAACVLGVIVVLFIGASQLYLGLHFVTDLLAGWTAGTLLALAAAGFLVPDDGTVALVSAKQ